MNAKHVVIIPYYSEEEIDRYLKIADHIRGLGKQKCDFEFLLAASPQISPNQRLYDGLKDIAPAKHFACPTKIFGYPQGPTAMFWDCMDHLSAAYAADGGFGLWLESDMVPVKPNWLDRIADDWNHANDPLVMGCFVPEVIKRRFIGRKRVWIAEHVNGGACYAKDFAKQTPDSYRNNTFDMAIYPHLKSTGRFAVTQTLAFSTIKRCRRDMQKPENTVLHGFMQDKNEFVDKCAKALMPSERTIRQPTRFITAIKNFGARLNLRFIKRGRRAMLQALLMEQEALWQAGALKNLAPAKPKISENREESQRQVA